MMMDFGEQGRSTSLRSIKAIGEEASDRTGRSKAPQLDEINRRHRPRPITASANNAIGVDRVEGRDAAYEKRGAALEKRVAKNHD